MIDTNLEKQIIAYNQSRLKGFRNGIDIEKNNEFEKILSARYQKVGRVKRHLVYLVTRRKYHYFVTFTFSNLYINSCDRTKRDLIKHALKSFSDEILYILNVDYGSRTEREHFHCIVGTDSTHSLLTHLNLTYFGGFFHVQKVILHNSSISRLSKYINKLTNHCIKDSTRNKRIVYNFKGYDVLPPPLNRYMFILDSFKLESAVLDKADINGKVDT